MDKIVLILILLCSSSSYSNELPSSLFGIELGKPAENYLIDRKEFDEDNKKAEEGDGYRYICNTNEHLDTVGGKPWKQDEKIQIDLIANPTFQRQCFSWDEHNIITSISASVGHDFEKNFQKSPPNLLGDSFPNQIDLKEFINFKNDLEESLTKIYGIDKSEFKHFYVVNKFDKGEFFSYLVENFNIVNYSKNNKNYLLVISFFTYVYKDGGGNSSLTVGLRYDDGTENRIKEHDRYTTKEKFDATIELIYSNLIGF